MSESLKSIFTGESLFKDPAKTAATQQSLAVTQDLSKIYSEGGFGVREYYQHLREKRLVATTKLDLAELHARAMTSATPMRLAAHTADLQHTWIRQATENGGFLTPDQRAAADEQLSLKEEQAIREMNILIAEKTARQSPLSIPDQDSLRALVKNHFTDMRASLEDKDFLETLKADVSLMQTAFEFNNSALIQYSKLIGGESGLGNVADLKELSVILNDEGLKALVSATNFFPGLEDSGLTRESFLASMYKTIIAGNAETGSPFLNNRRDKLAMVLTKKGSSATNLDKASNDAMERGSIAPTIEDTSRTPRPENLAVMSNKIMDNLLVFNDEEWKAHYIRNSSPEEKSRFNTMSHKWLGTMMSRVGSETLSDIFNPEIDTILTWDSVNNRIVQADIRTFEDFDPERKSGVHSRKYITLLENQRRDRLAGKLVGIDGINAFLEKSEDKSLDSFFPDARFILNQIDKKIKQAEALKNSKTKQELFNEALERQSK